MTKKQILCTGLAAAMTFSLAACSSTGSSTDTPSTTKGAGDKTVVEVWTEDRHDLEYVEKKINEYNETNTDNIEIKLQVITDNYANMIKLAVDGNTAPDIVGANSLSINNFVDTGILISLNDYIDGNEEYKKVNEPYENAIEGKNAKDGKIYSVYSGMRSGVRVEYNKDILTENGYTEIPDNLEDYIEMAKDLTEKGNGKYYGIGFTSSSSFERLLEMVAQVSGIYYYDFVNGKYDFSGYKPILEMGNRFIKENIAYPDQQGTDNMRALFAQGEFALWSNASQEAGVFTNQIKIENFEWGVAPVPSLDGEIKGALETTPSKSYGILSSSDCKDEAWKVIEYFQSEEFLKGYLEGGYCLPISTYMDGVIDKSKIGRLADFSMLDYESVYPAVPEINLSGDNYRTVLWNAVMGYVTADEAINDLNTRYNEALEADIKSGTTKRIIISDYDPLHPSKGTVTYSDK